MRRLTHVLLVAACVDAGDPLYVPQETEPAATSDGLLRVTSNPGGDYVRGVTEDGRVVYLARGLEGGPQVSGPVSVAIDGGVVREEAGAYRTLLPSLELTYYAAEPARVLLAMRPVEDLDHTCALRPRFPAPGPAHAGWRLYRLPADDGPAFSGIPRTDRDADAFSYEGINPDNGIRDPKRIRYLPAIDEAERLGTNPWGPAVSPDGRFAFLSDGVTVWRYDLMALDAVPVAITEGAYPSLSHDGSALLVSRAGLTDSVSSDTTVVISPFASCTQSLVTFSTSGWAVFAYDLVGGSIDSVTQGAEAVPLGDTAIVVRRPDGLFLVELSTGASRPLVREGSVTSPAVARDGSFLAFTSRRFGNPDILVLRID